MENFHKFKFSLTDDKFVSIVCNFSSQDFFLCCINLNLKFKFVAFCVKKGRKKFASAATYAIPLLHKNFLDAAFNNQQHSWCHKKISSFLFIANHFPDSLSTKNFHWRTSKMKKIFMIFHCSEFSSCLVMTFYG